MHALQVLNGIAAIVAIQAAGLAVSQALWSGLSVFVSFIWGAAVFRERVRSLPLAIAGGPVFMSEPRSSMPDTVST